MGMADYAGLLEKLLAVTFEDQQLQDKYFQ
jgi:hypothetical protein